MKDLTKKKIIAVISSHETDWRKLQRERGEGNAFSMNSSGEIVPIKTIENHNYDECKILWIPEVNTKWKTIVQILQNSFDNIYIATHSRCESYGPYYVEIKLPKISFSHDGDDPIWRDILEPLLNSALEGNGQRFSERLRVAYEKFEDKITNAHVLRYYILSPLVALDLLVQNNPESDLLAFVKNEMVNCDKKDNVGFGCNVATVKDLCNCCGGENENILNEFKELCNSVNESSLGEKKERENFQKKLFGFAETLEKMIKRLEASI